MSSSEPPPGGQPPGGQPPQGPPPGGYPPPPPPPPGGYPPQGPPPSGYPPQGPPPGGYPPPPPPGGYPPQGPPPGGYPPPPPGGGYPPPPQGPPPGYPGGYGQQPPQRFAIGDAFNYGWTKFQQNVGTILLAALAWLGILLAISVVWILLISAIGLGFGGEVETNQYGQVESSGGGFFASLLALALMMFVVAVVGFMMQAGIIRGALQITYGRELTVGTTFSFTNLGAVVVAALLIAVMSSVGFLLCYVPGLIVIFFTQYTMFFLVDKDMTALEAIKASASFVNRHLGTMVGFYIATAIAYFVGTLLCYVGLLLAVPVVIIAQTYAYRTLQGEQVAP